MKFKEAIGLKGLYTMLRKKRRFEHQEKIECKGVKSMGELMENKDNFSKVGLWKLILVLTVYL